MAQKPNEVGGPDEIKRHIEREREVLGANIEQLEHRVRSATDWRTWLNRKPLLLLGLAFGGGLYLSLRGGR
jgi:hypothetical protein